VLTFETRDPDYDVGINPIKGKKKKISIKKYWGMKLQKQMQLKKILNKINSNKKNGGSNLT